MNVEIIFEVGLIRARPLGLCRLSALSNSFRRFPKRLKSACDARRHDDMTAARKLGTNPARPGRWQIKALGGSTGQSAWSNPVGTMAT
jgi:hypothetical protein